MNQEQLAVDDPVKYQNYQDTLLQMDKLIEMGKQQLQNYHKMILSVQREMHFMEKEFWLDKLSGKERIVEYKKFLQLYKSAFGKDYPHQGMQVSYYTMCWTDNQRLLWKKHRKEGRQK